jgi:hypothetical protein
MTFRHPGRISWPTAHWEDGCVGVAQTARRYRQLAAEASARFDTGSGNRDDGSVCSRRQLVQRRFSLSLGVLKRCAIAASELPPVGRHNFPSALSARPRRHARPPPLLVGQQQSRTRKVALRSSWPSISSLMKRSRGSAGVELGSVAIASSPVTTRLYVGIRRHLLL